MDLRDPARILGVGIIGHDDAAVCILSPAGILAVAESPVSGTRP